MSNVATLPQKKGQKTALDTEVLIVGAGFSGIGAGIKLKQAGIPFIIVEKANDLGGTWRDNTYPGIAVDITSFTYSYSFEQNPNWSRIFAPGKELKAYADHCADKYGIRENMRFNTGIEKIVFDEQQNFWSVFTESGEIINARYVISAVGGLTQPKRPDIEGIDDFKGKVIHTSRWDHKFDLKGRRVGIIGTGATAVQLIPTIAESLEQMYVYQRTPIWIIPKPDAQIGENLKWFFRAIPYAQTSVRLLTNAATELLMVLGVVYNKQTPVLVKSIEALCMWNLKRQVPDPRLQEKLTPKYGFGCKRPSFSSDYYMAFNRSNVELKTEGIKRILKDGIETKDGQIQKFDTLILATGFKVFEKGNTPTFEAFGCDGLELGQFWHDNRYQAYQGATVPKFPNLFLTLGPYSTTGASWFSMVEAQVSHAMRCITEARRLNKTRIEVTDKAHQDYFAEVLERQTNTVFYNNNCTTSNSYYFDHHGDAPFIRPSSGLEMWVRSRYFDLKNYNFS